MFWFFIFFLISGFCSILYELVWLRLAMADFGVTTALTSIVLSVFMAGLGLGSWASGRMLRRYQDRLRIPPLLLYSVLELLIGISALLVPGEFLLGRLFTQHFPLSGSLSFYLASGFCITAALLPWCACMGATIPVGMLALRSTPNSDSERTFSYLYLANVTGALLGTTIPLLLIELYGFRGTLKVGATLNLLLAVSAALLNTQWRVRTDNLPLPQPTLSPANPPRSILLLLFATGLTSMGMELIWIRLCTPYVGTMVYAFAAILAVYLCATSLGAMFYRITTSTSPPRELRAAWSLLGLCGLLPLLTTNVALTWWHAGNSIDPYRFLASSALLRILIGIGPFSAVVGFITPMLVDRWSGGDSDRAGTAYAINVLGCIAGPLLSGFLLLPLLDERFSLAIFALPWFCISLRPQRASAGQSRPTSLAWSYIMALAAVALVATSRNYQDLFPNRKVLRDHTATVVAADSGRSKRLLVNGVGMTSLSPITKMMAHLPMAALDRPPQNTLVICFGMGTTFRSLLSWGVPTTAVELVPSVPLMFSFFHPDAPQILQSPNAHIVIDDGRRYLERTADLYDVIAIDPPPPVEAAGSSLLYTKEFYLTIRQHLRPGGILEQWFPDDQKHEVLASVTKALHETFPYVHAYPSMYGWGIHFLASDRPITLPSPQQLVARMPHQAQADMMEWTPNSDPAQQFATSLTKEVSTDDLIAAGPGVPTLEDDRPVNEYGILRRQAKPGPAPR